MLRAAPQVKSRNGAQRAITTAVADAFSMGTGDVPMVRAKWARHFASAAFPRQLEGIGLAVALSQSS
jgi:hypothetical protein